MTNYNRVRTSTTSTGTGSMTTGAAAPRCNALSKIPVGKQAVLLIENESNNDWEVSKCTITSTNTFTRDEVKDGLNFPAKTDFGPGTKVVSCVQDADDQNGINATDLANIAPTGALCIPVFDPSTGLAYSSLVSAMQTLFGSTPADTTDPTLSSPTGASTGTTTASGSVTTNEGNGTLYCLATVNATESVATVKASGGTQAITSTGSKAVSVTGLNPGTQYYLHFVQRDAAGNDSARVTSAGFTTAAAGDTTAPILSSPTGTQTGQTTATGTVSTNEANGTLYRYLSTNAVESATTVKAANLIQAVTATGTQNVSATGLTAATTYYWHYVHRDAAGNDSTVANSASFTTASGAAKMSDLYIVRTHPNPGDTTTYYYAGVNFLTGTISASGDGYFANNANVRVATPDRSTAAPTADVVAITWHTSKDTPPILANQNKTGQAVGLRPVGGQWGNGDTGNPYYGVFEPTDTLYVWGPPGNYYLWIFFADGSASVYKDGGPEAVALVLTASA